VIREQRQLLAPLTSSHHVIHDKKASFTCKFVVNKRAKKTGPASSNLTEQALPMKDLLYVGYR